MIDVSRLSVALVQPKYSINIGYVARVMKNFGTDKLLIVGNKRIGSIARKYASHGVDILEECERITFRELVEKFDLVIGTTAISNKGRDPLRDSISPELAAKFITKPDKTVLVLGRDTTGLKREELALCDVIVTIRTDSDYQTLNISHALAILLYVFISERRPYRYSPDRNAKNKMLEYVNALILKSFVQEHKREHILFSFKKLINESRLRQEQFESLLGFFRKMNNIVS